MHETTVVTTVIVVIGLLLVAAAASIGLKRTRMPYTVGLVLLGLVLGWLAERVDALEPLGEAALSPDMILFVFLPTLIFESAFNLNARLLSQNMAPVLTLAVPGLLLSTAIVGGLLMLVTPLSLGSAMLFGALISATDPVAVIALFKEVGAPEDLKTLVEGESLFNDATGVVLFTILLKTVLSGQGFEFGQAVYEFVKVSVGGLLLGIVLGWVVYKIMSHLEDHLLENALCLVLAYGSFWLAEVMHLSGVITTVMAGLMIGNYGRRLSMSEKTTKTVEIFFESIDFLINSFLFILIGLELRKAQVGNMWMTVFVAIAAMMIGRAAVSYSFYWLLNQVGTKRPKRWKHILFWGGLRGSIPIALLLQLPNEGVLETWRPVLVVAGFGCVFFSLVVQGITMGPLMRKLGIGGVEETVEH